MNELKNEQAIEALADMLDPITEIATDNDVIFAARSNDKAKMIKLILKNHAKAIIEIMAIIDGVPVDEYECNLLTLPVKLIELFNRPEFSVLFPSQGQTGEQTSSGSAMESIEDAEK